MSPGIPQKMWNMKVVWPVVALFGTVSAIWDYFRYGRLSNRDAKTNRPVPVTVGDADHHFA